MKCRPWALFDRGTKVEMNMLRGFLKAIHGDLVSLIMFIGELIVI